MGPAPLVSLLMLTMSSEVSERGEARHCHREPMMAAKDWRKSESEWAVELSSLSILSCRGTSGVCIYDNIIWYGTEHFN